MTIKTETGGCLCGNVRYEIIGAPLMVAICYCTHCQRQSGSMLSINISLWETNYRQTGITKTYEDLGDSGHPVLRDFCPDCGSPIASRAGAIPGLVVIKAGTLDDGSWVDPGLEVYTDHAPSWIRSDADMISCTQAASDEDLAKLMAK